MCLVVVYLQAIKPKEEEVENDEENETKSKEAIWYLVSRLVYQRLIRV